MKGFLVLLVIIAAVQARTTAVQRSSRALAALGDNPGLVHLRLAVTTSGLLKSCAGSLIDESWVLTSASCVNDARFIWVRYGVVTVINPSLVTETSAVRINPTAGVNAALVGIGRVVQSTDNIAPVSLLREGDLPEVARQCGFGANEEDGPGDQLVCADVELEGSDIIVTSGNIQATQYDDGVPLVSNGVQIGLLVNWSGDNSGEFLPVSGLIDWIESVAEIEV